MRLADFGYSRFYKEQLEGEVTNKNIDMESLAGTPVFMAPEALYCVMYPGGSYDHTVDIWSVGALLYRVLVGKCGFFAPIQDILSILQKKGTMLGTDMSAKECNLRVVRQCVMECVIYRRRDSLYAGFPQDHLHPGAAPGCGRHPDARLQGENDVADQGVPASGGVSAHQLRHILSGEWQVLLCVS